MRARRVAAVAALLALGLGLGGCAGAEAPEPEPTETAAQSPEAPAEEPSEEPSEEPIPPPDPVTVRIGSLTGPTTMGLVSLMADADAGTARHDYQVTVMGTADELVPKLVQGELDVALVPANLAAVLHHRTRSDDGPGVQVAAINTLGVLEVVETGETIHSMSDLAGRTVYSMGKGTTPEYVLNHLLRANGLEPGTDVTVEFRSEATEVAALLASEPDAVGVLPQPFVTALQAQNPATRSALSLTEEWAAVTPDSQLVTGVLVVRHEFAQEQPGVFADLLADYAASIAFTNEHPQEAGELIAAVGIVPAAPIATAAIPRCNIVFIDGEELRTTLTGYLEVLAAADPQAVGGSVPGDDFFWAP